MTSQGQISDLVDRMRRARNATTRVYMPAALLAVCDLAEQGKVRQGRVRVDDYRPAFQRLLLEVWPEREDFWFRPMLHVREHGLWEPLLHGAPIDLSPRSASRLDARRAAKIADALQLTPELNETLSSASGRDALRGHVYRLLESDDEPRSTKLAEVHQHLDPTNTDSSLLRELVEYEHRREERSVFDDMRTWMAARRVVRRGQPSFRRALLVAYGGRCCISDADAEPALEAAHIVPFLGEHSNATDNGLLLRADLHTLFDEGLLTIRPKDLVVHVNRDLRSTTYRSLHDRPLRAPLLPSNRPDPDKLDWHHRKNTG